MNIDDESLTRAAEAERELNEQMGEDLLAIMATPTGRRFVWNWIRKTRVFMPVFAAEHAQMALLEGSRQVGLMLLTMVDAECPELYPVMVTENSKPKEGKDE